MPHGRNNKQQFQEMNESMINHLFLPYYLPSSAENDFCLRSNHQNEYIILESMTQFLNSYELNDTNPLYSIIQLLIDCTQRWTLLQKTSKHTISNLKSIIEQLPSGAFLPIYFHTQNASILIEIDEKNPDQPLISSWQVLLPTDTITSSLQPHFSCFPVTTYRLSDRSDLTSTVHCELLLDFMKNPIEYSKCYKGSREVLDTRDVPLSHYVCQWWVQQFPQVTIEDTSNTLIHFNKKHRDQIRWNHGQYPFRRSGLWMTIKTVFQIILTKRLGSIGTIIYKLLITHFLTYILHTQKTSTDLLVHCIRKILRRLNKIDNLLASTDSNEYNQWIQFIKEDIQTKMNKIFPNLNWQKSIQIDEEQHSKQYEINSNLNDIEFYRHPCELLKKYLNNRNSKISTKNLFTIPHCDETVHSPDQMSFNFLTKQYKYPLGIALTQMELWILSWCEQWTNQSLSSRREPENFQMLYKFYDDYRSHALNYYCPMDSIGYSRFILTSLTIIRTMHVKLCQDKRFERLEFHLIDIPNLIDLFEYLILPTREDMIHARGLLDYFNKFVHQPYPDLLSNIEDEHSFGVYFASNSTKIHSCLKKLQIQIEEDKLTKIEEVRKAKDRYNRLMNSIVGCPCTCYGGFDDRQCRRCRIEEQANNIDVNIYECPIPSKESSALAVLFELRMPIEIRCYRDILWLFINRSQRQTSDRPMYEWLRVLPHSTKLESLYTGPNDCRVKLVSSKNSITQNHDVNPSIALAFVEDFLYENSLTIELTPVYPISLEHECQLLTPQLNHPDYKPLQYSIGSTKFVQNQVIADLSHLKQKLKPKQFIEYGSFRSGHRLQWWNLLALLEMDSLSLNDEHVAILIIHSILQYGPITENAENLIVSWCSQAHEQLLDDDFIDELISRLNRHLDDCASNWQNEFVLIVITMITMRLLTICNSTREEKIVNLILKCRRIGEKWIDLISTTIQMISSSKFNEVENLRLNIVTIGIACLLTFSTHSNRIHSLLSSNQQMISLLKAITNIHDNMVLNKKQTHMSSFLKNLIRFTERVLVELQPTINEYLRKTSYQSLDDFSRIYWSVLRHENNIHCQWKKRHKNVYDGWYDGQYNSTYLSIDCLQGTFLVNGMTISYLPDKIVSNELYLRIFNNYIFQVQISDTPNTYITKYSYHENGKVQYEFCYDDEYARLIIRERHLITNDIYELIPAKCFENELPLIFVTQYSHWKNIQNQFIEFRSIHFNDPNFLKDKPYLLNIQTGYLTTNESSNKQILVNQSSSLFLNLFTRYFIRLDEKPYVYMMRDNALDIIETDINIHIYLSRLAIAFKYNTTTNCFISREYSDMCIDQNQWFGTLTGLRSGLLLTPNDNYTNVKLRKLLLPFGHVYATRRSSDDHQIVTIQRSSTMPYAHQYFVFILNDRLRIIQSTDSPTGWLYLALLHAMTSHILPDEYTDMTGMERAFQLLNSAGSWSDQPYDSLSLNILRQLAIISPKATYNRQYNSSMAKIEWNCHSLPYSLQHCGYYLIAKKLIDTSEKLNFMHSSTHSNEDLKLTNDDEYDENLLIKLYSDYRNSYNPIARLSSEIESEILDVKTEISYQLRSGYATSIANPEHHIINDMYQSGDISLKDVSELSCFPLKKWLTNEYTFNIIWIGLLKLADSIKTLTSNDDIKRFELLIDFLSYISKQRGIKSFYLQVLNTILHVPTVSLKSMTFPPFTQYNTLQQISATMSAIKFNSHHSASERRTIFEEVKNSFDLGHIYKDQHRLATTDEKNQIKLLMKTWHLNRKLHTFLIDIQNLMSNCNLIPLRVRVPVYPQQFIQKSIEDYYQIEIKSSEKPLDQELFQKAQEKYLYSNSNDFIKSTISIQTLHKQKEFPNEIFSSIDDQKNHLNEIGHFFKKQLTDSWKQLQSIEIYQREYPSKQELLQLLQFYQQESNQFWKELIESLTHNNEQLFQIGLVPRITPSVLISLAHQVWLNEQQEQFTKSFLSKNQCILLGGLLVNWIVEQQIERALHFDYQNKREEFEKELSNPPHTNWIPSKHLPWLIFELEMNITIREIQVDVARHMIEPKQSIDHDPTKLRSIVMQMNMGEGKTSVIIPMLALSLCSSISSLVRIVLLKSLFPMNYQSLRYKLGGLLNRRIFPFSCRRDMNFTTKQVKEIFKRLQQGLKHCDIILVSPEDILSFDLLTIDKCRKHEYETGRSMLKVQQWLKTYIRDILDESDEILHCKYQLIYTVGTQQQVDGGVQRWKLIQWLLNSVKKFSHDIAQTDSNDIIYKLPKCQSAFPEFRLLTNRPFPKLCAKIINDWLNHKSYRKSDKQLILSFVLDINTSIDALGDRFSFDDIQLFLIIRGLLSAEVLCIAFKKRYRVNYGVNTTNSNFNRLMAVPFRAKDVPADRTEFGHPDTALVLTQLSYYYSGLKDLQIIQCFDRLNEEERDPESIYTEWISQEDENDIPQNIRQWKGVNLKDGQQETRQIFDILRYNMLVINYFLNHFVFPREAKQYPHKLVSSPWDLSSTIRSKIITGFSGTNDTQLLLPVHIHQYDLPQLQQTDAIVIKNLLQIENENYHHLPANVTSEMILYEIVNYVSTINVILDVGALFIDGTNREIAMNWLKLSDKSKIDYVIYFEYDSIIVCDRQYHHHSFLTSPASERLDRCIIYFDEVHTRGTDFKFPNGFKAAVTLGNGLTKDRFVQACMRMRKLGTSHSLIFWSSDEVHRQILALKTNSNDTCQLKDILRWVYENTQETTWDGLHHWAIQSLSFQRKLNAFANIQWTNSDQIYTDDMMNELAEKCLEPEVIELKHMYGLPRALQTLAEIYTIRYQQTNIFVSEDIHKRVFKRLQTYGGSKQRLSHFLNEEQQRELEQELAQEQEREQEHEQRDLKPIRPCQPILHEEIKRLCGSDDSLLDLAALPLIFRPLPYAFTNSTLFEICQLNSWQPNLWISTEFQRVVETKDEPLDAFLRPPRWIIVYRNEHIIFVNAFEANWLMNQLHYLSRQEQVNPLPTTTLRLLLPRLKQNQSIFVNTRTLTIPNTVTFNLPLEWLVQLFLFNGTLYFETIEEQTAYCHCLALCPRPRTSAEENVFEDGWIAVDGFVEEPNHRSQLHIQGARFISNPLTFVKQLLTNRNNTYAIFTSHVGSIVYDGLKMLSSNQDK